MFMCAEVFEAVEIYDSVFRTNFQQCLNIDTADEDDDEKIKKLLFLVKARELPMESLQWFLLEYSDDGSLPNIQDFKEAFFKELCHYMVKKIF